MGYSFPEIKEFSGLFLQANSFTVPDGAMEVAENAVIKSDNIVQKTRGSYIYFNPSTSDMNQLFKYRDKLLAIYSDKLVYYTDTGTSPNETGAETTLSGATISVTGTRVSRSVESSNNLYFTTDNGVLKIENYNSTIYQAGAPQGLDLGLQILASSVGPIDPNTTVGYRVVFGRRDDNDNLILGAPSNIGTIYIPNGGTGVSYTSSGAGPYTVTVTSTSHGLKSGDEIVVTAASDADAIGTFTITVTGTNTFTYSTAGNPSSGTLTYTFTRKIRLEFSIPSDISASQGWFYQVYRSSQAVGNVTPSLDFKLASEVVLTSTEISNRVAFFDDDVDDILLGAELYTNPNSREGELQSNFRPPLCEDICLYKNSVLYANCTTRHLLELDVVDTSALAAANFVEIKIGSVTRRYKAQANVSNQTVKSQSITNAAGNLQIDYQTHGFANNDSVYISNVSGGTLTQGTYYVRASAANSFEISTTYGGSSVAYNSETSLDFEGLISPDNVAGVNWSRSSNVVTVTSAAHGLTTGMTIQVTASAAGAPNVALANYVITSTGANTFTFAESAANSSGTLDYRLNSYMFALDKTSTSVAVQLRTTASGLVKAVNRDPSSLVYANYTSTTIPGQMRFIAKGFTDTIYVRANSLTAGTAFLPALPDSFSSGTQVFSDDDVEPNVFYASKLSESEAVPLVNRFPVGAKTKKILRVKALRDSVIIVKEDGLFRLTGDNPSNYTITILDSTVICVARSSVDLLNNEVILLSNQGVCRVSESSVQIVSRRIDDVIQPILGSSSLEAATAAVAYESDRIYYLTTILPSSTTADQTYLFNVLNQSWTTTTRQFKQAIVGPGDILYYINLSGDLYKERKKQTRIDYCGQNTTITVVSVSSDGLSSVITSSVLPEAGDVIIKNDVFSRIVTVVTTGSNYTVTFGRATNIIAAETPILYKRIISTIKMAPFHGGNVGRMKQFAEMQLHFRDENFSRASLQFSGYAFGGAATVDWSAFAVSSTSGLSGWGYESWGFFPWGLTDVIAITSGTSSAPVCRTLVPLTQQRNSFIQPIIIHREAGESINLQALQFTVRGYQQRTSR